VRTPKEIKNKNRGIRKLRFKIEWKRKKALHRNSKNKKSGKIENSEEKKINIGSKLSLNRQEISDKCILVRL